MLATNIITVNNFIAMKLKKGSAAAKAYMAKLRAAKGKKTAKKVGSSTKLKNSPAARHKFNVGDLVKLKGKSWVMRVDKIVYAAPFGNQYFLENDARGTRNGNAGSYFENEIEAKIGSSKKVGAAKLKTNIKEIVDEFNDNENENAHTLNVVLLAKNFGTATDLKKAKELIHEHNRKGYLTESLNFEKINLYKKLYPKFLKAKKAKTIGSKLNLTPKETRLGATEKDFKTKPKTYHKDTKSHNVNIKVVSGVDMFEERNKLEQKIKIYTDSLHRLKNELKNLTDYTNPHNPNKFIREDYQFNKMTLLRHIKFTQQNLLLLKSQLKQQNKLINDSLK